MSAQTVHPSDAGPPSLPRTQNDVARALPPADRMEFYREMGEADEPSCWACCAAGGCGPACMPTRCRRRPARRSRPGTHRGVRLPRWSAKLSPPAGRGPLSDEPLGQDDEEEEEDRIRLAPAVCPLLNPDVSRSIRTARSGASSDSPRCPQTSGDRLVEGLGGLGLEMPGELVISGRSVDCFPRQTGS